MLLAKIIYLYLCYVIDKNSWAEGIRCCVEPGWMPLLGLCIM